MHLIFNFKQHCICDTVSGFSTHFGTLCLKHISALGWNTGEVWMCLPNGSTLSAIKLLFGRRACATVRGQGSTWSRSTLASTSCWLSPITGKQQSSTCSEVCHSWPRTCSTLLILCPCHSHLNIYWCHHGASLELQFIQRNSSFACVGNITGQHLSHFKRPVLRFQDVCCNVHLVRLWIFKWLNVRRPGEVKFGWLRQGDLICCPNGNLAKLVIWYCMRKGWRVGEHQLSAAKCVHAYFHVYTWKSLSIYISCMYMYLLKKRISPMNILHYYIHLSERWISHSIP